MASNLLVDEGINITTEERPMDRQTLLQECDQALSELLPDLPRPEQKSAAALLEGIVAARTAVLSQAAAGAPGEATDRSKQRRAQRLLANPRFDAPRAQRRVLQRILAHPRRRVDLLIDAVTTGDTATQPGTQTVCLALAWHGRALPLLWRSWQADAPGQCWMDAIAALCQVLAAELPAGTEVVVMADRGLSGERLATIATAHGWSYLLRTQGHGFIRTADGWTGPVSELVPTPGTQAIRQGVLIWAADRSVRLPGNRVTSYLDWERCSTTNVVAVWRDDDREPWLLLTNLPPMLQRVREYRRRTWEEELFRDLKSFGWQWQQSRVRRPERVERLLVLLALATLWVCCMSQRVVRRGWRRLLEERSRRCYSRFQLGLRWIHRQFANDGPIACILTLYPD
jgi:DDE family transposase